MEIYQIALIGAAVAVVLIVIATFSTAMMIHRIIFGGRQDKNPIFKYFTAEDFSVDREVFPVRCGKIELNSHIYRVQPLEKCDKVVIFAHGFGAGAASYTTEIAHLARAGYAVVATDAYGCNGSVGKQVKGFYAGTQAVIATFDAVKADARLCGKKVLLVGHSWGAYSVLTAAERVAVDGVVAMSSFDRPAQTVCDNLVKLRGMRLYAKIVHAHLWFINLFKFGARGNRSAARAAEKCKAPVLLIHGEKDGVVPLKHSAAAKAKGGNIEKLILSDKRHNPYNTPAAEDMLSLLNNFEVAGDAAEEFFATFDWSAATEEDEKVMAKIDSFISAV